MLSVILSLQRSPEFVHENMVVFSTTFPDSCKCLASGFIVHLKTKQRGKKHVLYISLRMLRLVAIVTRFLLGVSKCNGKYPSFLFLDLFCIKPRTKLPLCTYINYLEAEIIQYW